MWKVVRIPAGNATNVHYNFVVAKPLVLRYLTKIEISILERVKTKLKLEQFRHNLNTCISFDCKSPYQYPLVLTCPHIDFPLNDGLEKPTPELGINHALKPMVSCFGHINPSSKAIGCRSVIQPVWLFFH